MLPFYVYCRRSLAESWAYAWYFQDAEEACAFAAQLRTNGYRDTCITIDPLVSL